MLWWMLRMENWLDIAPLENMEEDDSFLFLKKNLMNDFFFFFEILNFLKDLKILINEFFLEILKILNFFKELKVLIDVFFFFESNLRSTRPMPLVPRPFLKISFFFFFFERFRKNYYYYYYFKYEDLFIIKKWRRWR